MSQARLLHHVSPSRPTSLFSVVGSISSWLEASKAEQRRLYPGGVVEVENPEHNDFLKLRPVLMWCRLFPCGSAWGGGRTSSGVPLSP